MPDHIESDKSDHKKGPWSSTEDQRLVNLVRAQGGAENWVFISTQVSTRTAKQCRERWHQNLKPSLNHGPITPEEGEKITKLHDEMGSRWADIAREIPGRSDNAIKNWWNGGENRRKRDVGKGQRDPSKGEKGMTDSHHEEHRIKRRRTDPTMSQPRMVHNSAYSSDSCPREERSISVPHPSRRFDGQLVSPMSDRTPSLISDNSSSFSQSPAIAPSLELDQGGFSRRNSRPNFPHIPSPSQSMSTNNTLSPVVPRLPSIAHAHPYPGYDGLHRLADAAGPLSHDKSYNSQYPPRLQAQELPLRTSDPLLPSREFAARPLDYHPSRPEPLTPISTGGFSSGQYSSHSTHFPRSSPQSAGYAHSGDGFGHHATRSQEFQYAEWPRLAHNPYSASPVESVRPASRHFYSDAMPHSPPTTRPAHTGNGGSPATGRREAESEGLRKEQQARDERMKLSNLLV